MFRHKPLDLYSGISGLSQVLIYLSKPGAGTTNNETTTGSSRSARCCRSLHPPIMSRKADPDRLPPHVRRDAMLYQEGPGKAVDRSGYRGLLGLSSLGQYFLWPWHDAIPSCGIGR